ncbi:NUDIX hydrolase [Ensifer soli]|uniref:NUDIX hydrolase n=1 Tax=Ciceribacter sp. sgz301302 TaxID=3342379 RepID=UPI0035B90B1B
MSDVDSNPAGWPPENTVFPVASAIVTVSDERHPFDLRERARAAENWEREIAANPALFDGRMVLQHRVRIAEGVVESRAHLVPFSTFLWWRRTKPAGAAYHLFALPVILSSDGAVIAIRMARTTANPGRVYCAAGSLDANDIVDGVCDLDANMVREVAEETGLDLRAATAEPGFHGVHVQSAITLFRRFRFAETADVLVARIAAHIATDPEPEIDEAIAIRDADPGRHTYATFMPPILAWVFREAP